MYYYFQLQLRMLKRQIVDFGLHPVAGLLLAPLVFVGLSFYFFVKMPEAAWLYAVLGLVSISQLSNIDRTSFLRLCFSRRDFYRIRLVENALALAPFVLFLCCKQQWMPALGLLLVGMSVAILSFGKRWSFTLPTPFFTHPFEYLTGFRSYWLLLAAAYVLAGIAVSVHNFNLGLFALLVLLLSGMTFYSVVEQVQFVWIFSVSPRRFLWYKIRVMLVQTAVLCAPVLLVLSYFFLNYWYVVWVVFLFGLLLILLAILAKYATFPKNMSLPQAIIVGISVALPPMLLLILPLFYRRAILSLKAILQ